MMHYILDACALLIIFNGEPGAQKVLDLLDQAETGIIRLSMSIVQLTEIFYDRIYVAGIDEAKNIVESILAGPITIIDTISHSVMYDAGRFKTSYSMSLGDTFAAATAKNLDATLVTKDDEMKEAEKAGEFSILWLK